jgi:hypothetical protein
MVGKQLPSKTLSIKILMRMKKAGHWIFAPSHTNADNEPGQR